MPRQHSGFTLIELMVTVTVLVILGMIAVPSFKAMVEKGRLRGAADDVVNLLGVSRTEAIKRQRSVAVALSGSGTTWCVGANRAPDPTAPTTTVSGAATPGATACDCTSAASCVLENQTSVVNAPTNVGVTASVAAGGTFSLAQGGITFNAQTGALVPLNATPGVVTLTSPSGYAIQITVSALGQVSACVPATSSFISGYQPC